jgi:hypothetical protein
MARHQNKQRQKGAAHTGHNLTASAHEAGESMRSAGERTINEAGEMAHGVRETVQEGTHQFAVMGERAFEAWMRSSNETLRRVLEVNEELAAWSREQLDDSINAVRSLAQCRSVGDAYGVHIGLMQSSMEKSLRHAGRVFNLATHAITSEAQSARRQR